MAKIQNQDVKSLSDLTGAGATKTSLINTDKIYTAKSDDQLETVLRKNNFSATAAPTVNDDTNSGFEAGSEWIDTTNDAAYVCLDASAGAAVWQLVGSGTGTGGGALNFYSEGDMEDVELSDFSKGNNAVAGGGGADTENGTLALETGSPLRGTTSLKYTLNATPGSSDDDYVLSENISIPKGYRGRFVAIRIDSYTYDGADDDLKLIVANTTTNDVPSITSDDILSDSQDNLEAASNGKAFVTTVFIPASCTQIRMGFQVVTHASGSEVFTSDDWKVTPDLASLVDLIGAEVSFNARNNGSTALIGTTEARVVLDDVNGDQFGSFDKNGGFDEGTGIYTVPQTGTYVFGFKGTLGNAVSEDYTLRIKDVDTGDVFSQSVTEGSAGQTIDVTTSPVELTKGQKVEVTSQSSTDTSYNYQQDVTHFFGFKVPTTSEHIVTPAGKFDAHQTNILSTDVLSDGTISDLTFSNLVVGRTYRGHLQAILKADPGDLIRIDIKHDGNPVGQVQRTTSDASSAGEQATHSTSFYFVATSTTLTFEAVSLSGTSSIKGSDRDQTYAQLEDVHADILAAIPIQKTAYLKDVKASGTQGGTFTSGAWQTRDLNTVEGDSEIVTLSANQFTLTQGVYELEAIAPAVSVNRHKARLRNITDGTTAINGSNNYSDNTTTNEVQNDSKIKGRIEINSTKTFEIQHQCETSRSTAGFGFLTSFFTSPEDEVYTQVKITKIK